MFDQERETAWCEQIERGVDINADVVTEGHFGKRGSDACLADAMQREEMTCRVELVNCLGCRFQQIELR